MPLRSVPAAALAILLFLPVNSLSQIQAVALVDSLAYPLHVCAPPGDDDRLFIVGHRGDIRILENGSVLPEPFLDLTGIVSWGNGEEGLLGLAFDPDYDANGHFYVSYTRNDSLVAWSIISRYTVSANPDSADPGSVYPILALERPVLHHNGGSLVFGPAGYLWTGFGDAGSGGALSQDPQSLHGKMIRIDPSGDDFPGDPDNNYAIPPTNPFVGDPTTLDEIWSLGWRNPWRFTFDSLTGDLYVGDVGKESWEEIDFEPAGSPGGLNYGWSLMEGPDCFNPPADCNDGSLTLPIHAWPHGIICNAAAGGYVYRGSELVSWLQGHYFFSDYCQQTLWSFRWENGVLSEFTNWTAALGVGTALKFPASFWEDEEGELYVVEYRNTEGQIWKIVPDPSATAVVPPATSPVRVSPAHPNPFRESTRLSAHVTESASLDVSVHDAAGRLVRRLRGGEAPAGIHAFYWDGRDGSGSLVPAGVYFVRVAIGETVSTRRVIRIR